LVSIIEGIAIMTIFHPGNVEGTDIE
jgi:hypothetical protein